MNLGFFYSLVVLALEFKASLFADLSNWQSSSFLGEVSAVRGNKSSPQYFSFSLRSKFKDDLLFVFLSSDVRLICVWLSLWRRSWIEDYF